MLLGPIFTGDPLDNRELCVLTITSQNLWFHRLQGSSSFGNAFDGDSGFCESTIPSSVLPELIKTKAFHTGVFIWIRVCGRGYMPEDSIFSVSIELERVFTKQGGDKRFYATLAPCRLQGASWVVYLPKKHSLEKITASRHKSVSILNHLGYGAQQLQAVRGGNGPNFARPVTNLNS